MQLTAIWAAVQVHESDVPMSGAVELQDVAAAGRVMEAVHVLCDHRPHPPCSLQQGHVDIESAKG